VNSLTAGADSFGLTWHRGGRVRGWLAILCLVLSDLITFCIAYLLFQRDPRTLKFLYVYGSRLHAHEQIVPVFLVIGLLFVAVRYVLGDYTRRQLFWDSARATTRALLVASVPDVAFFILSMGQYPFFLLFGTWAFMIVMLPVARQLTRMIMPRIGLWLVPTALVGSIEHLERVYPAIADSSSLGFDVKYVSYRDPASTASKALARIPQIQAANSGELATKLMKAHCEHVVLTTGGISSKELSDTVQRLMEANISVNIVPSFSSFPLVGLNANSLFGRGVLMLQVRNNLRRLPQRILKRSFDIVGSIVLLILFSPVFLWIAIAIKRDDGGPVFFSQNRVGYKDREFSCLKFRTMMVDAEERMRRWREENPALYAEFWEAYKLRDDPRVTKVGKWLRSASLDELPQLLNVLIGDLSLVGPRPVPREQLIRHFGHAAKMYVDIRPGLTGLWQISGRSDTTSAERIVYDEWYILNWSFWCDIVILLQTAWIVVTRKGAY
jgi:undecaprenyl-phosphate galactose phosphotransferase